MLLGLKINSLDRQLYTDANQHFTVNLYTLKKIEQ